MAWSRIIYVATQMKGVSRYLDRSIKDLSAPASITFLTLTSTTTNDTTSTKTSTTSVLLLSDEILWDSLNPSAIEWNIQNAWAKGLLSYNTKNPIGLDINITSTAVDAWQSYIKEYEVTSDIACQNTKQELQNMAYSDSNDFSNYITLMYNK